MFNSNSMRGEENSLATSPVLSLSTTTKKTLLFSFCFFFNIIFFFFNLKNFSSFILSLPFKLLSSPLPSLLSSLSSLQFSPALHLSSQTSPFLHFPLLPSRPRSPSSSTPHDAGLMFTIMVGRPGLLNGSENGICLFHRDSSAVAARPLGEARHYAALRELRKGNSQGRRARGREVP